MWFVWGFLGGGGVRWGWGWVVGQIVEVGFGGGFGGGGVFSCFGWCGGGGGGGGGGGWVGFKWWGGGGVGVGVGFGGGGWCGGCCFVFGNCKFVFRSIGGSNCQKNNEHWVNADCFNSGDQNSSKRVQKIIKGLARRVVSGRSGSM